MIASKFQGLIGTVLLVIFVDLPDLVAVDEKDTPDPVFLFCFKGQALLSSQQCA